MAYQTNLVFILSKSLEASIEQITKLRRQESDEQLREVERLHNELLAAKLKPDAKLDALLQQAKKGAFTTIEHFHNASPLPIPDENKLGPGSRLIVVAHGDVNDSQNVLQDSGDEKKAVRISFPVLATWIGKLLNGRKVDLISLHICYAGYSTGPADKSFGLRLAELCGKYADCVSARTGAVGFNVPRADGKRLVSTIQKDTEGTYRWDAGKIRYSTGKTAIAMPYSYAQKMSRDAEIDRLKSEALRAKAQHDFK